MWLTKQNLQDLTEFVVAVFVEKILRAQPNVKKLYLLLRAGDAKSAMQRFNNEVINQLRP